MKNAKLFSLIGLFIVFISLALLRFIRLGYSDYIPDEHSTFLFIENLDREQQTTTEYLLNQRKGPMQLLVGTIPYFVLGSHDSELAARIPFALANALSLLAFYGFIQKMTKSKLAALVASVILGVNGYIVGFGRIAQYQSLNLLFSFLALFFYADLIENKKSYLKSSLLGTLFFCFSILSHWDAVLIAPMVVYIFVIFLFFNKLSWREKATLVFSNFLLGLVALGPFLYLYLSRLQENPTNQDYFFSRMSLNSTLNFSENAQSIVLYNPLYTIWFLAVLSLLSLLYAKKALFYYIWLLLIFYYYAFFVGHAGTHIYNLFIPWAVVAGIGASALYEKSNTYFKKGAVVYLLASCVFLYLQAYLIFVDVRNEYPWEGEKLIFWEIKGYDHEDSLRHLLGFPKNRYWDEINLFIKEQNASLEKPLTYITNETKSLSTYYMDVEHKKSDEGYFAVGIKKPHSFVNDYRFSQLNKKSTIKKFENEQGETVVRIYLVEPK